MGKRKRPCSHCFWDGDLCPDHPDRSSRRTTIIWPETDPKDFGIVTALFHLYALSHSTVNFSEWLKQNESLFLELCKLYKKVLDKKKMKIFVFKLRHSRLEAIAEIARQQVEHAGFRGSRVLEYIESAVRRTDSNGVGTGAEAVAGPSGTSSRCHCSTSRSTNSGLCSTNTAGRVVQIPSAENPGIPNNHTPRMSHTSLGVPPGAGHGAGNLLPISAETVAAALNQAAVSLGIGGSLQVTQDSLTMTPAMVAAALNQVAASLGIVGNMLTSPGGGEADSPEAAPGPSGDQSSEDD